jgi:hypothetical protein
MQVLPIGSSDLFCVPPSQLLSSIEKDCVYLRTTDVYTW